MRFRVYAPTDRDLNTSLNTEAACLDKFSDQFRTRQTNLQNIKTLE